MFSRTDLHGSLLYRLSGDLIHASNFNCNKFHMSSLFHAKLKRRQPPPSLKGKSLPLPGYISARELSKKLTIDIDQVINYAREVGYVFKKPSEIILDYQHASEFVKKYSIEPIYEEIDIFRSDYWSVADSMKTSSRATRPSVISVMGEIDHGKTTLLDKLSNGSVAQNEAGFITQCISAFTIDLDPKSSKIPHKNVEISEIVSRSSQVTFLDTPGHSAFFSMRRSGAAVSDFILLLISATDGIKSQTIQIIQLSRKHCVPIIVVINKIDVVTTDKIETIYNQLRELGVSLIHREDNPALSMNYRHLFDHVDDVHPVVSIVEISALLGTNLDILKQVIRRLHLSMEQTLHIDPEYKPAEATVVESYSSVGLGRVMLLIVHLGTLKRGDWFILDRYVGSIKTLRIAEERYLTQSQVDSDITKKCSSTTILSPPVEYVRPGYPVLVSGIHTHHDIPAGATMFILEKEKALEIQDYRNLFVEYNVRKINGVLFHDDSKQYSKNMVDSINRKANQGLFASNQDEKKTDTGIDSKDSSSSQILIVKKLLKKSKKSVLSKSKKSAPSKSNNNSNNGIMSNGKLVRKKKDFIKKTFLFSTTSSSRGGLSKRNLANLLSESLDPNKDCVDFSDASEHRRFETLRDSVMHALVQIHKYQNLNSNFSANLDSYENLEDIPEEHKNNLSIIIKADHQGRLDAIVREAKILLYNNKWHLKILRKGIGELSPQDLFLAQVEIEENKVPRIPVYLFNVSQDASVNAWIKKNPDIISKIHIKSYNVFLDILKDIEYEISAKRKRQSKLDPIAQSSDCRMKYKAGHERISKKRKRLLNFRAKKLEKYGYHSNSKKSLEKNKRKRY